MAYTNHILKHLIQTDIILDTKLHKIKRTVCCLTTVLYSKGVSWNHLNWRAPAHLQTVSRTGQERLTELPPGLSP